MSQVLQEGSDDSDAGVAGVAMCVDLDGTLLNSDVLYESLLALIAKNPLYVAMLPLWLLRGKAVLKREIAARVELDVRLLPYNLQVVDKLRQLQGRPRVLCTASDEKYAVAIADHLGVFDLTFASDGTQNLAGHRKARLLVERFGERGFDYAGNQDSDLKVWERCRHAWVCNASSALASKAGQLCQVTEHLPAQRGTLKAWLKAVRLHQWLKNMLVFVPLLAAHRMFNMDDLLTAFAAFAAFGLCASGVYILNDLLDLRADRQHPRKRMRSFAAGRLPLLHGLFAAPMLTIGGFALGWFVDPTFMLVLLGYYAMTLAYSLGLKRLVMVDVVVLAGLYTVRIIGGAAAVQVEISFWLLAFSMFMFLSLAMLKRYTELVGACANGVVTANGRGYDPDDVSLIRSMGASSGYTAILVFALYINSPESMALYERPQILWLICPALLYWVSRAWIIAHRGAMHDDPVVFAITDRLSQVLIALCALLVLGAI